MGFNNSTKMKYKKRENIFSNSTGSCRYFPDRKIGMSYGETIFLYDSKLDAYIINAHKFSVTTSKHYWYLINYIPSNAKKIYVDVDSLNNYSGLRKLSLNDLPEKSDFKLFSKKQIKEAKNTVEKRLENEKARLKDQRIKAILEFRYKTSPKNWLKHWLAYNHPVVKLRTYRPDLYIKTDLVKYLLEHRPETITELGLDLNSPKFIALKNENTLFEEASQNETA